MHYIFKSSLMYGSSRDMGCFMKTFCFNTICNITHEPQKLQRFHCPCMFIGKCAVIKYHQLISKVINQKLCFDQLATTSSSTTLLLLKYFANLTWTAILCLIAHLRWLIIHVLWYHLLPCAHTLVFIVKQYVLPPALGI